MEEPKKVKAEKKAEKVEAESKAPNKQAEEGKETDISDLNLEEVKDNWQRIIDHIPTPHLKISFRNSTPIKIDGEGITLECKSEFDKESMEDIKNRREIIEALKKTFAQPVKYTCVLTQIELEPVIKESDEDKKEEPTLVEMAKEIFNVKSDS